MNVVYGNNLKALLDNNGITFDDFSSSYTIYTNDPDISISLINQATGSQPKSVTTNIAIYDSKGNVVQTETGITLTSEEGGHVNTIKFTNFVKVDDKSTITVDLAK